MSTRVKVAAAIIIGVSALAFTASDASAAIACNRWGECWRVRGAGWRFPPSAGIVIHPDSWRWGRGRRIVWRGGRTGRGFWRNGVWVRF